MDFCEINQEKLASIIKLYNENKDSFPKISIFIVAFKAGRLLEETLNRIPRELIPLICEVFVIDDFSEDDTYFIGKALTSIEPWKEKLKVFYNPKNYGYGGNQKIGYSYSIKRDFDYVILLHGDGQYAPEYLPNLIYPVLFQNKNVVFGTRMKKPFDALRGGMPLYKFVGNKILSTFSNIILNLRLSEFHSGYRLYSCHTLKQIPFIHNSDDFHFDTQIIIQCKELGIKIYETEIPTYYGDEICRVNGLKYAFNVVKENLIYRLHQLHIIRRSSYIIQKPAKYTLKKNSYSSHQQIANLITEGSKVLDIGCGKGVISALLKDKNISVTGIDTHEKKDNITSLAAYYQLDLDQDLESLSQLGRSWDYIILADVVEHLVNGKELLEELKKNLKPDGRLIASTGNIAIWFYRVSLLAGRFQYGEKGILDRTHVRLYTKSTWLFELQNAGFKVIRCNYTPIPFENIIPQKFSFLSDFITFLYQSLVVIYPSLFAYQIIVEAEMDSLDYTENEGLIDIEMYKIINE